MCVGEYDDLKEKTKTNKMLLKSQTISEKKHRKANEMEFIASKYIWNDENVWKKSFFFNRNEMKSKKRITTTTNP